LARSTQNLIRNSCPDLPFSPSFNDYSKQADALRTRTVRRLFGVALTPYFSFVNITQIMKRNVINTIARVLLALPFIVFGLNKFLGFAEMPPPSDPTAQAFLGAMFTSYLAPLVGAVEVVAAVLLLTRRTAFLGNLLLLPVTVNIAAFHVAHDMPGNGIWIITTLLHVLVALGLGAEWKRLFGFSESAAAHSSRVQHA
jgi:uncharacterized membrane protein YphA (DoxX/SURF4 family)